MVTFCDVRTVLRKMKFIVSIRARGTGKKGEKRRAEKNNRSQLE
jgi:hypothetical protein